ncbi:hypothetical protein BT69DRAFT_1276553 [Atractiella rhizophila]|nr:hypothetical protein BT69DRAFT_1276553 [Atractiella rhizophila]
MSSNHYCNDRASRADLNGFYLNDSSGRTTFVPWEALHQFLLNPENTLDLPDDDLIKRVAFYLQQQAQPEQNSSITKY